MLPELVPPIASIFMLFSSNAFRTPACAIPLIPPPDNANPSFVLASFFVFFIFYILFLLFTIFYAFKLLLVTIYYILF